MTDIEQFLFAPHPGRSAVVHVLTFFEFVDKTVTIRFRPAMPEHSLTLQARFDGAVIESIEEEDRRDNWPLTIIGVDSYKSRDKWRFVLNCGCIEWSWESEWPTKF